MKKKVLWTIIIVAIIILGVGAFILVPKFFDNKKDEPKEELEKVTPLMYKVTKEGSNNTIYLFGSIHAANADKYEYPDYFNKAYDEIDYIACEYDITNNSNVLELLSSFIYLDGTTVEDHISEESYNKLSEFFEGHNYKMSLFGQYKMSIFYSLLENFIIRDAGLDANSGIDMYFLNKGKEDGKSIIEVESENYQMNLLANTPDRVFEILTIETLDNYEQALLEMKNSINTWKSGEESILDTNIFISSDKYSEEDYKLILDFYNELLNQRNEKMLSTVENLFNENKKVLFMVGAGHIVGDTGIVKELEEKGYTIEKLNK